MRYALAFLVLFCSADLYAAEEQPPAETSPQITVEPNSSSQWRLLVNGSRDDNLELTVFRAGQSSPLKLEEEPTVGGPKKYKFPDGPERKAGNYTFIARGKIGDRIVVTMNRILFSADGTGKEITDSVTDAAEKPNGGSISPTALGSPIESDASEGQSRKTIAPGTNFGLVEFTKQAVKDAKRPYFDHHPIITTAELSELLLRSARAAKAAGTDQAKLTTVKQGYKKEKDKLLAAKPGRKDDWAYVLRVVDNQIVKLKEEGKLDFNKPSDMAAIYEEIGIAFADLSGQAKEQRAEEDTLMAEYLKQGNFRSSATTVGSDRSDRSGRRNRGRCSLWSLLFGL